MKKNFDIIVVGGGLVGQIAALACAKLKNMSVALVDGQDIFSSQRMKRDGRAFALSASSLRLLSNLGLDISAHNQIMQDMLITDGPLGVEPNWRVHFGGEDYVAKAPHMIESSVLSSIVASALKKSQVCVFTSTHIKNLNHDISGVTGEIEGQTVKAKLLIAADGQNSPLRVAAGISTDGRDYGQSALVTTISHSLPHEGLALQRFLPGGPLAVLPLIHQRSQIVWSDKTSAVEAALSLSDEDFLAELTYRLGDYLGELAFAAPRQSYPLKLQLSQSYVGQRLVLIGDAAHIIHPLAGQGLNLGLRDVAALYDVLKDALSVGRDIGGAALADYAAWRKLDVTLLAAATDSLSYIYGSPRGPISRPTTKLLGHFRRFGLSIVDQTEMLKDIISSEAAGEIGDSPSLLSA